MKYCVGRQGVADGIDEKTSGRGPRFLALGYSIPRYSGRMEIST